MLDICFQTACELSHKFNCSKSHSMVVGRAADVKLQSSLCRVWSQSIKYLGVHVVSGKVLVQGEHPHFGWNRGGVVLSRKPAISLKRGNIGPRLLFRLVPKSTTLDDLQGCRVPVGDNTNNDIQYNFIYKTKHVGYVWAAVESTFECPSARPLSLQTACPVTRDDPTKYWVVTKGHYALCFKTRASFGAHHENLNEDWPILSATKM